jgi:hypothetical protein
MDSAASYTAPVPLKTEMDAVREEYESEAMVRAKSVKRVLKTLLK